MPVILVFAIAGILTLALACLLFGLGAYGLVWFVRRIIGARALRQPEAERLRRFPLGSTESATMTL